MKIVENIRRYKYLPFSEGSLRIIKDGTIKFAQPSKLNDPFDCAPDTEIRDIAEYLKSRPDMIEKAGEILNLSSDQLIEEKPTMIKRVEIAAEQGKFCQPVSDSVGVCSLTRDPLNLLMWAHYAQDHTGFVVEFDIPVKVMDIEKPSVEQNFEWLVPIKVEYQRWKPVISFFDDKDKKIKKQFLVKGEDWAYEQEERVIDYIRGYGIHKYDRKTILHSVFAGMKMDDPTYTTLVETVSKTNREQNLRIEVYRTEAVKGRFELFVPGRSDLKPMKPSNQKVQPTCSTQG